MRVCVCTLYMYAGVCVCAYDSLAAAGCFCCVPRPMSTKKYGVCYTCVLTYSCAQIVCRSSIHVEILWLDGEQIQYLWAFSGYLL